MGLLTVAGVSLVAIGAILLADRLIAPVLQPLKWLLHSVGIVAWPLALIAVGVVLITASRHQNTGAKLYRSRTDRVIGGVLGGIAARWGLASGLVRVMFVVSAVLTSGIIAFIFYILAMAFIPEQPAETTWVAPSPPIAPVYPAPPVPSVPRSPVNETCTTAGS
jgi:phage shock protein PspC (stress-responsive transcriptional regulator)